MDKNRKEEILYELVNRTNQWLDNSDFEEFTCNGSLMRFEMALGMLGYPFLKKEPWMGQNDFNTFISEDEFEDEDYNYMLSEIFKLARHNEKLVIGD